MHQFKKIGDRIYIGAHPTDQDTQDCKRHGIRTVIDFRMPGETSTPNAARVQACGMEYANVPTRKRENNPAAMEFIAFVKSADGAAIFQRWGWLAGPGRAR